MWEDRRDRIDFDAPRTVWSQVADDLRKDIETGRLSPGTRLPAFLDLADIYGVSDHTIRRVIRELRKEKRVVVTNGRGTYIT